MSPDPGDGSRPPQGALLGIGVFGRRSRLSPKALRLYDGLGLLVPADVDPVSGYRRYREEQLATARLIVQLRRLDMPLAEVAEVLAAPGPQAAQLVEAYWDGVERRVAARRGLAAHLRIRLSGGAGSTEMFDIKEREVPAQRVLTEQRHLSPEELPGFIGGATGRLTRAAEKLGGPSGNVFVVYHGEVDEDGDGPVEVCVPVAPAPGTDLGGVAVREEPGHREAYTRLTKGQVEFPQILSAYEAVSAWVTGRGHRVSGEPREVYFTDWEATAPDQDACDVAFPFA
ncbi:MerR family transcriptional regulator [Streptacidiphilus sp. PB12-B1b]|uniref:MerR family transcriptional regulator n=1 Tax=Streptacidiphilus sp. PB12-B1b TaxID=2705012 RepID=UPI0015FABF5C|nr:MerR family transcriptional regulator [Streptacidiphilus sp. PB12-B1b]QMU75462.1 MerR family transcriptional regulator [Streptacidiphilus sp. PB12-B1b]